MMLLSILTIFLCVSPASIIKLKKDNEVPKSMLLRSRSALLRGGIGFGILCQSIAGPITNIQGNPFRTESKAIGKICSVSHSTVTVALGASL